MSLSPKNGADDVDPKTRFLRVKFNMPMDSGMSWTGSGPGFPEFRDGQEPKWSPDGLTCSLPVVLEADHDYQLGLNDAAHINFNSKWGVPLAPIEYTFHTRAASK